MDEKSTISQSQKNVKKDSKSTKQSNFTEKVTVLVIDDDKWISRVLCKNINSWGFETICAYDGAEGIIMAIERRPKLIFLDVILPDIKGEIIARILKKLFLTSEIPIIIMSGNLDKEALTATYKAGADGFVTKPFSLKTLYSKMEACLSPTIFFEITASSENLTDELIQDKVK